MDLPPWDPVRESCIVPDAEFHIIFEEMQRELATGYFRLEPIKKRKRSAIIASKSKGTGLK